MTKTIQLIRNAGRNIATIANLLIASPPSLAAWWVAGLRTVRFPVRNNLPRNNWSPSAHNHIRDLAAASPSKSLCCVRLPRSLEI